MGMEMIVKFYCDGRFCGNELETDMDVDEFAEENGDAGIRAYEEYGPYENDRGFKNVWHFFYTKGSGPYGVSHFTGKVLCDECARDWYVEKTGKEECSACSDWKDQSELDNEDGFCHDCYEEDD